MLKSLTQNQTNTIEKNEEKESVIALLNLVLIVSLYYIAQINELSFLIVTVSYTLSITMLVGKIVFNKKPISKLFDTSLKQFVLLLHVLFYVFLTLYS